MQLLYDLAIPFLSIYPKEMKTCPHKDFRTDGQNILICNSQKLESTQMSSIRHERRRITKKYEELGDGMFINLIVMMSTYMKRHWIPSPVLPKMYQIVYFKYLQFILWRLYLNKAVSLKI